MMIFLTRLLRYSYEGFTVYLVLLLFYAYTGTLPPMFPFILAYLFPVLVMYLILRKRQSVSVVPMLLLIPVFAACSWVLGFSPMLSVLLAVFCLWRGFFHFFNYSEIGEGPNEVYLFFGGLALALVSSILFSAYAYHEMFLLFSALQFVFLLIMKGVERFVESSIDAVQSKTAIRWAGGTLGGLIAASLIFLLLFPVIKWVFFTAFGLVATVIGWVIAYPVLWFISFILSFGNLDRANRIYHNMQNSNANRPRPLPPEDSTSSFPAEWIWIFLLCAFLFVLIWFIGRKIRFSRLTEHDKQGHASEVSVTPTGRFTRKRRAKPPKDPVRLRFYQLQKKLAGLGRARSESESVSDWFGRLDLGSKEKDTVAAGYQKVRYGETSLSADEFSQYDQAVKAMIRQAKEKKKEEEGTV